MYVRYERVCHTISGLKMLHPEDPPPTSFGSPKNMWGRGIFHVVRRNISQKFLALPPPNIPGLKGGGFWEVVLVSDGPCVAVKISPKRHLGIEHAVLGFFCI